VNHHLLFDVPVWAFYISAGCLGIVWILTSLLIVLVEAVALRVSKWGTLGQSLRDALFMNIASALIGCAVPITLLVTESIPQVALGLAGAWLLSVIIEGGVLTLITANRKTERRPARQIWLASVIANTASYAMLAVLIFTWASLEL
jgi:hypothetical protein